MSADQSFAEFHAELRTVARRILGTGAFEWATAVESGWSGLDAAETVGGAGATFAELAVVIEELGRACAPSPMLGTVVLGAAALAASSAPPEELLAAIVDGSATVALAIDSRRFRVEPHGADVAVNGRCAMVIDAPGATEVLLVAADADGHPVLVRTPPAVGLEVIEVLVVDATRSFATVTATDLLVPAASVIPIEPAALQRVIDRGLVALACDALGVAEAMLAATVAYAGQREQFGRPIGSFQAVKHQCADMAVKVAIGRELIEAAIEGLARPVDEPVPEAAMAKAYLGDAAVDVCGTALQLHGGYGYTWESGIHVHLKRAMLDAAYLGGSRAHRAAIASRHI